MNIGLLITFGTILVIAIVGTIIATIEDRKKAREQEEEEQCAS